MKVFASVLALAASSFADAQAPSGLKPAKVGEVVAATQACLRATQADRVDEALLRADGWETATISADGKAVDTPLRIYGRKTGHVIIMLMGKGEPRKLCTVMARVPQIGDLTEAGTALAASFGKRPAQVKDGGATWFVEDKLISLQATGSREKPSLRVSVMVVPKN
jgi:hypothetical protein